ncbi:MAG TPA: class I SAM-dependent methyltransferase [Vicinamibacterales bacterium]|nr:class I SAM-dependent methyltransferase [Vicinamibacterales bacterium]
MTVAPLTACRICGSALITAAGWVEYLQGYRWPVYDCGACGCRFTPHDSTVHDRLHHQPALSYYRDYRDMAERSAALFAARDLAGLTRELGASPKYRFVIEQAAPLPLAANMLEVGCSRGYLTSYFIAAGRRVFGVDVSAEAVRAARDAFGDHFGVGLDAALAQAPFDFIYHVGLIGCVADPLGLTRQLLEMLKPGGMLVFNAPNRMALASRDQLWFDSAPPPDLVTLFAPGFWRAQVTGATVFEDVAMLDRDASLAAATRRLAGMSWQPPQARPFSSAAHDWPQTVHGWRPLLARALAKAARLTGVASLVGPRPSEFGLFVRIVPEPS